jgi:hypothetical protein
VQQKWLLLLLRPLQPLHALLILGLVVVQSCCCCCCRCCLQALRQLLPARPQLLALLNVPSLLLLLHLAPVHWQLPVLLLLLAACLLLPQAPAAASAG